MSATELELEAAVRLFQIVLDYPQMESLSGIPLGDLSGNSPVPPTRLKLQGVERRCMGAVGGLLLAFVLEHVVPIKAKWAVRILDVRDNELRRHVCETYTGHGKDGGKHAASVTKHGGGTDGLLRQKYAQLSGGGALTIGADGVNTSGTLFVIIRAKAVLPAINRGNLLTPWPSPHIKQLAGRDGWGPMWTPTNGMKGEVVFAWADKLLLKINQPKSGATQSDTPTLDGEKKEIKASVAIGEAEAKYCVIAKTGVEADIDTKREEEPQRSWSLHAATTAAREGRGHMQAVWAIDATLWGDAERVGREQRRKQRLEDSEANAAFGKKPAAVPDYMVDVAKQLGKAEDTGLTEALGPRTADKERLNKKAKDTLMNQLGGGGTSKLAAKKVPRAPPPKGPFKALRECLIQGNGLTLEEQQVLKHPYLPAAIKSMRFS
jgi:hypothetical protein